MPTRLVADLAALRLLLTGESVVDLTRYWFSDRYDVDVFLRLSCFDTDNPLDLTRLGELHHEAMGYLSEIHNLRVPAPVEQPTEIHDVFLMAAGAPSDTQRAACTTLKVMHILHHINGRELDFNTPISEAELFQRLNAKVFAVIDRMRASGIGVQEFSAGKKSRTSQVTKLLARRGNLTTHIFDKVRFRIIVKDRQDLVGALVYLGHNLVPFNFVVPEQSHNGIVTAVDVAAALGVDEETAQRFLGKGLAAGAGAVGLPNEFSGRSYRSVNFVADIPLRIDDVAPEAAPAIGFVQAEIQVVDVETSLANETGENAHALYKERQHARIRARLVGDGSTRRPDSDDRN